MSDNAWRMGRALAIAFAHECAGAAIYYIPLIAISGKTPNFIRSDGISFSRVRKDQWRLARIGIFGTGGVRFQERLTGNS